MNAVLRNALAVVGLTITTQAAAQVVFYEHDDYQGRSFTTERRIGDFERHGFDDRASSVVVLGDPAAGSEEGRYGENDRMSV